MGSNTDRIMKIYGFVTLVLVLVNMTSAAIFSPGTQVTGWYDAPAGFGRTEFQATIDSFQASTGDFTATGTDKQGDFTLKGKVEGNEVNFVKDFTDAGGYKDIKYQGTVDGDEVNGTYKFFYKALFISLPIHENFYMKVSA